MYCFTSITNNYLPKARVLGKSLKKYHPDWKFIVVISEPLPDSILLSEEPFDHIITIDQLDIPNYYSWVFSHNVMEICTAAKGPAAKYIIEKLNAEKLIYLDPDIAVLYSLKEISELLDNNPIILTPHQTKAEKNYQDILANEVCFLKHGIYNLGFFAVRNQGQGKEFINWYCDRLLYFCYIDFDYGLYTDQRWCDLVPVLFDALFILRDPAYNVARWNISQRTITRDSNNDFFADGHPIRFFHFSGHDSGQGPQEVSKYFPKEHVLFELWNWYSGQLIDNGQKIYGELPWKYNFFSDGTKIENEMRLTYRRRLDLQTVYKNPFSNEKGSNSYFYYYSINNSGLPSRESLVKKVKTNFLSYLSKIKNWLLF
jgi:hypothetical protein